MTEDDFNAAAWASFVQFAWSQPDARAAFTEATGIATMKSDVDPLSALIDEATGRTNDVAEKFIEWVTRTQWGLEYAPKSYREALLRRLPTPSASFEVADGVVTEVQR